MSMIKHHLKVAFRNLMKYKLQTIISILSIAIGIVTLAFAHSATSRVKLPSICSQPYYERTYEISFETIGGDNYDGKTNSDNIRALKENGGLGCVERMAVPNIGYGAQDAKFELADSTERRTSRMGMVSMDPEYFSLIGLHSAITGRPIKELKAGEGIISKEQASKVFGDTSPIGAVLPNTNSILPVPVTIVDVYEELSTFEKILDNGRLYFSLGAIEDDMYVFSPYHYMADGVFVVLKKGCTEAQLEDEVNARMEPFNLRVKKLSRLADDKVVGKVITRNLLVHLIGVLILIAAIIGFLRIQIQLFWMRKRELSLRVTNGAKRRQLFAMLFLEVLMAIGASVILAMLTAGWLENFVNTKFSALFDNMAFHIHRLGLYSLYTGILLLAVCCVIIWIVLRRICKAGQGLAANMRNSRSHLFRNAMLGIQVIISILFVCATLMVVNWADKMMEHYHVSENNDFYKQCIYLKVGAAINEEIGSTPEQLYQNRRAGCPLQLMEEIEHLPDLKQMISCPEYQYEIRDIKENPEAQSANHGKFWDDFLCNSDTTLLSFYDTQVGWLMDHDELDEYLVLSEKLYNLLTRFGLANNGTLALGHPQSWKTYPIAGVVKSRAYTTKEYSFLIEPDNGRKSSKVILVPKEGRYKSLLNDVNATIQRRAPSVADQMVFNFHDYHQEVTFVETYRKVSWILGAVSLIICAMGIYSTIALDTRSRRKEVAMRKVNGAKRRDIYRLFGRLYLILVILSLVIALPLAFIFCQSMKNMVPSTEGSISAGIPCLVGSLIVIGLIALIVTRNIRKIMRIRPSELIAKE